MTGKLLLPQTPPFRRPSRDAMRVSQGVDGVSYYLRNGPDDAPTGSGRSGTVPRRSATWLLRRDRHSSEPVLVCQRGSHRFPSLSSHVPDLTQPDQANFDLGPGETASFHDVREAALRLHDQLEQAGVRGYPKTSGGRGLHIYLPLAADSTFEHVHIWIKAVEQQLATPTPELFALAHGPTHRGERVTIDYAHNSDSRNIAAPYTLRASAAHPTVSAPLTWEELEAGTIHPTDLTPQVVFERVG